VHQPCSNLQEGYAGLNYNQLLYSWDIGILQGKKPHAMEKVKDPTIREIIAGCIHEAKENRYGSGWYVVIAVTGPSLVALLSKHCWPILSFCQN